VRRRLLNLAAAVSLVLCVTTVVIWARSYWVTDTFEWASHYRTRFVAITGGRVLLQVNHGPSATKEFEPVDHDAYVLRANDRSGMGRPWRFGGFWIENLAFAPSGSNPASLPYTDVVVPLYALVLASLILPGATLRRVIRERTHRAGVCPACGYDLRATPDRCPECGTERSQPSQPRRVS